MVRIVAQISWALWSASPVTEVNLPARLCSHLEAQLGKNFLSVSLDVLIECISLLLHDWGHWHLAGCWLKAVSILRGCPQLFAMWGSQHGHLLLQSHRRRFPRVSWLANLSCINVMSSQECYRIVFDILLVRRKPQFLCRASQCCWLLAILLGALCMLHLRTDWSCCSGSVKVCPMRGRGEFSLHRGRYFRMPKWFPKDMSPPRMEKHSYLEELTSAEVSCGQVTDVQCWLPQRWLELTRWV